MTPCSFSRRIPRSLLSLTSTTLRSNKTLTDSTMVLLGKCNREKGIWGKCDAGRDILGKCDGGLYFSSLDALITNLMIFDLEK